MRRVHIIIMRQCSPLKSQSLPTLLHIYIYIYISIIFMTVKYISLMNSFLEDDRVKYKINIFSS